ncbi:MAG: PolC-type DNA polymerase III [Lachnospiraceae bacterium]|nr:PolC-type DNA polymerase III [Lachnospiraceae bacterium]
MDKKFFQVFEGLELPNKLRDLFENVDVERITISKSTKMINTHIFSKHIINRDMIKSMESCINKQLFRGVEEKVRIFERYEFKDLYGVENVWDTYKDNIDSIMKDKGNIIYSVYREADITFNDNIVNFNCENSFIAKQKANELKKLVEYIFNVMFDYDITVEFEFNKEVKHKKNTSLYGARESVDNYNTQNKENSFNNGGESYNTGGQDNGNIEGNVDNSSSEVPWSTDDTTKVATGNSSNTLETNNAKDNKANDNKTKDSKTKGTDTKQPAKKTAYDKARMGYSKLPDDPNIFYGRNFEGDVTSIIDIQDEIGDVIVKGKILNSEVRNIRNEKAIITFSFTDFTDSITSKIFIKQSEVEDYEGALKKGNYIEIKGIAVYDSYIREISISSVVGIRKIQSFETFRMDDCEEKRVELHAHTKMSDMDGLTDTKALVQTAEKWGHKAVAITDHGVVQAFPDAAHAKSKDFKVIYGMEAYLVDDVKELVSNSKGQSLQDTFVVFDIETTGFGPVKDQIIEIGAVKVTEGKIVDRFSTFVNPQVPIPFEITNLTGITDANVANAETIDVILPQFLEFCRDAVLVAHNASFDVGFISKKAEILGLETEFTVIDTVALARVLLPHLNKFKLDIVAKDLGISLENHHRAVDDATATADIFIVFLGRLLEKGIENLNMLNEMEKISADAIKKMPSYHAIILAKNDIGRVNLYRLVSLSHIEYFARRPRIPKSLLMENREGLILGSACEAGELYQAILRNQSDREIARLVDFYDYLEIQPLGNNKFMIDSPKYDIESYEDLKEINKKIVRLGEEHNKPVVATCDVHFLNPQDEVYRRIIMAGKGFSDADDQAPLYFHTTREMLDEFSYLGEEKAREVVITNTNLIADSIENISPVRPDKCPPVIEDSDEQLRKICYDKATSMYGENLPEPVKKRLEHELNSIISNGFAVMYIIAQKLVWKSNEDGYLVGSRGSVGSSFAATMSGITEVNPLPAHYYCEKCHYSDFDSEDVKKYSGSSGCDMPDKKCPNCGADLCKDGHDIPFETFLGFYGDKEPDIDLNFSGEYQSKAHAYTEVIFGEGQTFRAGTIGGVAEKTAFGYVKGYFNDRGITRRNSEIERIAGGCVGVKRTTGQHPGGIVVLPLGEEIYSFTPVQRPANDMTTSTITTHFDYHSIDHNLLKLDILGHDDPTMIRMLEDITGLDAKEIRLDEPMVLSLFESTKALKLQDELMDCDLGSLGIPEFGTEFVMQMLRDTKPKNFSDLVRISGLSHGTDVWLNNAQYFIAQGACTLSTAICTRDDIMTYLIYQGVENGLAFKIMESVRKGKGLTPDMEDAMLAQNVPEWYIESCKRIKYMFPKAHAAAYVMMAFRIAYFKVYHPLAYYAAYFSIRAKAFNYEIMCLGKEKLEFHMKEYKKKVAESSTHPELKPTNKEEDTYSDMRIVQEMYNRGYEFMPIDLFKAQAKIFQIIDGKIMPAFSSIDGLGDKAAESIVEGVKLGEFLSKDDFKTRCKVSSTVTDTMARLGILGDLPETNQISLMDMFGL